MYISLDLAYESSFLLTVGQCGNQIGCRFWDLALREHAAVNKVCTIISFIIYWIEDFMISWVDPGGGPSMENHQLL